MKFYYTPQAHNYWGDGQAKTRGEAAICLWEAWLDAELDSALGHLGNLVEGSSRGHSARLDRVRSWLDMENRLNPGH